MFFTQTIEDRGNMRRVIIILFVPAAALFAFASVCGAVEREIFFYDGGTIHQLTDNFLDDAGAGISDNGLVTWCTSGSSNARLFDGESVIELPPVDASQTCRLTRVNNLGNVAVIGGDRAYPYTSDLYIYQGSETTKIHSAFAVGWAVINNNGQVAFSSYAAKPPMAYSAVYLYDGASVQRLSDSGSMAGGSQINDLNVVVWAEMPGLSDSEIFLCEGGATAYLTTNDIEDNSPSINDAGQVAWMATAGEGSTYEIFLLDGGPEPLRLTTNSYDDQYPRINESGSVVWEGQAGPADTFEIFLLEYGGIPLQLTDNGYDDTNPRISDNGSVVWQGQAGNGDTWEIFLYNGEAVQQLTNNAYDDTFPEISADGSVVWLGNVPYWEVPASVVGARHRPASDAANTLCLLIAPFALVLFWKESIKRRKHS